MSISLDSLPNEFLLPFALSLPLVDISCFRQINQRFNKLICNNDYFWKQKFYHDYGHLDYTGNWKTLYFNFLNIWSFGSNEEGKLGLVSDIKMHVIPTLIPHFKVKQISVGFSHSAFIDLNGSVWTFGKNSSGQLGLGSDLRAMIK